MGNMGGGRKKHNNKTTSFAPRNVKKMRRQFRGNMFKQISNNSMCVSLGGWVDGWVCMFQNTINMNVPRNQNKATYDVLVGKVTGKKSNPWGRNKMEHTELTNHQTNIPLMRTINTNPFGQQNFGCIYTHIYTPPLIWD